MWTGHYCYGLQRSISYPLDGTFHNFVLALDKWEASLLENIKCHMDIFTAINKMEQSKFLAVTDGSVGDTAGYLPHLSAHTNSTRHV
eukprot:11117043-Ditylum_brightwellii.AAC.1